MVLDTSDEGWRKEALRTKFLVDRTHMYVDFVLDNGDYIREESPGVLQIRILNPKKEKPSE